MNKTITAEGWHIIQQDSHVGKWIVESKRLDHDQFLIPLACSAIKEGWIVMDCGALYGDHTIAYCNAVGNSGCVIAIEANPLAFECLCENAKRFQSPTVCLNLALSDQHGLLAVHIMDEANIGASIVQNASQTPSKLEKQVRTACIDGICMEGNIDRVDFIKLDVEGWEYKVLKGAEKTLTKFRPLLLIEMNSVALSQQGSCYKDIYDFLLKLNFSWRIAEPNCKGGDAIYNIVCWPNLIEKIKSIV